MDDALFGQLLRLERQRQGLSLRQLALAAHCSHAHIADLESGRRGPGESLVGQLERVLGCPGVLRSASGRRGESAQIPVLSHKFITAFVGHDRVSTIRERVPLALASGFLAGHWACTVRHPSGDCDLHIWDHGAVVVHLREGNSWPSLTSLAEWRYRSYEADLSWLTDLLKEIADCAVQSPYVFSAYWLEKSAWSPTQTQSALKLMCMPRTLLGSHGGSESVEAKLLSEGFDHEDLKCFGVVDTSVGYASWSGISYHPLAELQGISEDELVHLELAVQSLWVYCSAISSQIEKGEEPLVPSEHGWRWLRGSRSRLMTARTQETGHHRSLRESILETSGLPRMLDETIQILKEFA